MNPFRGVIAAIQEGSKEWALARIEDEYQDNVFHYEMSDYADVMASLANCKALVEAGDLIAAANCFKQWDA